MKRAGLLIVLAGLTVLVATLIRPSEQQRARVAAPPKTPGEREPLPAGQQEVENFRYPRYDDAGALLWEVIGARATLQGQESAAIQLPKIRSDLDRGRGRPGMPPRTLWSRADRALLRKDINHVRLEGHVHLVSSEGPELFSIALEEWLADDRITGPGPVLVRRPGLEIRGTDLSGMAALEEFTLRSAIRVRLEGLQALQSHPGSAETVEPATATAPEESIVITCNGPFKLSPVRTQAPGELKRWTLHFEDAVFLRRLSALGEGQLRARTLDLMLRERPRGARPGGAGVAATAAEPGGFDLESLIADGTVRVADPDLEAVCDHAEMRRQARVSETLTLSGQRTRLTLRRRAGSVPPDDPTAARRAVHIACSGPVVFVKQYQVEEQRLTVASATLQIERTVHVSSGPSEWMCDALRAEFMPQPAGDSVATSPRAPELRTIAGMGHVLLLDEKLAGAGDRIVWNVPAGDVRLTGDPTARATDGASILRGPVIVFDRTHDSLLCPRGADAELAPGLVQMSNLFGGPTDSRGRAPDAPCRLRSRTLTATFRGPGGRFDTLKADGRVVITAEPREATGEHFVYEAAGAVSRLIGDPVAQVKQGADTLRAASIDFNNATRTAWLRGPKEMRFFYKSKAPGTNTAQQVPMSLHTGADIVVFQDSGFLTVLGPVQITRPGSWLRADKMTVVFSPAGSGEIQHIHAWGHVLLRDAEGNVGGDYLFWKAAEDKLWIRGNPQAVVYKQGAYIPGDYILVEDRWQRITVESRQRRRILIPDKTR